jgi:hypothetical protein
MMVNLFFMGKWYHAPRSERPINACIGCPCSNQGAHHFFIAAGTLLRRTARQFTPAGIAARRGTRQRIAMARDEPVNGRPEPRKWGPAANPPQPRQLRQHPQNGEPCRITSQPGAFRSSNMHLFIQIASREGSARGDLRVVVVLKFHSLFRIVWLHARANPFAECAGTIQ